MDAPPAVALPVIARPAFLLQAESAMLLVLAVVLYARLDASWWLFAISALAPDLSALGYLAGARAGATAYNLAHWAALPAVLAIAAVLSDGGILAAVALVWFAHIAFDRLLGYGLKYATATKVSHLQRV